MIFKVLMICDHPSFFSLPPTQVDTNGDWRITWEELLGALRRPSDPYGPAVPGSAAARSPAVARTPSSQSESELAFRSRSTAT